MRISLIEMIAVLAGLSAACRIPPASSDAGGSSPDAGAPGAPPDASVACTPRPETCNRLDDDCDELVDDTSTLLDIVVEGIAVLDALDPLRSGIVYDHFPVPAIADTFGVLPGFFVAPQNPLFILDDSRIFESSFSASLLPNWEAGFDGGLVGMRFDFKLGPYDFAGLTIDFLDRTRAPHHVDLSRYDAVRIQWQADVCVAVDFKLKPATGDEISTTVPVGPASGPGSPCTGGLSWQTYEVRLDDLTCNPSSPSCRTGIPARTDVTGLIFAVVNASNATSLNGIFRVGRIELLARPEQAVRIDVSCDGDRNTPDDLVCGSAKTGADKAALGLLSFVLGRDLALRYGSDPRAARLPTQVDTIRRISLALELLERMPRWTGRGDSASLAVGEGGLLPNWFDPISGFQDPNDRTISLTDVADEVAVFMALDALLTDWQEYALAFRARALAERGLLAIRRLVERGRTECPNACPGPNVYGAVRLSSPTLGIDCNWCHIVYGGDTLLGTLLAAASGGADLFDELTLIDSCEMPPAYCPSPCAADEVCNSEGLCALDPQASGWIPSMCHRPITAPPAMCGRPPHSEEGGLFGHFKTGLFVEMAAHSESGAPALPSSTFLADSAVAAVRAQIDFGSSCGVGGAWGFSASADPCSDGYLGQGHLETDVVTPHALQMALHSAPAEACMMIEGLRAGFPELFAAARIPGRGTIGAAPTSTLASFGPRDAIDLDGCDSSPMVRTRDVWLSLDVSMGFLAVYNHLTGGNLRRLFARGGGCRVYEALGSATCAH